LGVSILYVLGICVAVYLGWDIVLFFMQPRLLYRPVKEIAYTPAQLDIKYEDVFIETTDGIKLHGWYIPAGESEFTVLFCHGNGGNVSHRLDSLDCFQQIGLSCLIFDYRGYGRSAGKPSERGTYLDARAAYEWLTNTRGVSPDRIIIFGRSLGGSIAAHLAGRVACGAMVLESAFTSYAGMGRRFYPYMPVRWFARFRYKTDDYIRNIACPILVIHSRADETVPFDFGVELYNLAGEPKRFVEISGGHNDGFLVSSGTYQAAWIDLTDSLSAKAGS